jgi:hypothetical protein
LIAAKNSFVDGVFIATKKNHPNVHPMREKEEELVIMFQVLGVVCLDEEERGQDCADYILRSSVHVPGWHNVAGAETL